ncbi:MAG: aminotransferase class I/II-fold pyridoxal phosphate-dependent enzyme [Pseudomonadota bacterium]
MDKVFSQRVLGIRELIFRKLDKLRIPDHNLIDLSKGLPTGLPPREVLYELNLRLKYAENHVYTTEKGLKELRHEVAYFYKDRYGLTFDPETEVQIIMGCKDGLAAIAQACVDPGDRVIVPDPSFPAYVNCVLLASGVLNMLPLKWENKYIPTASDLEKVLKGKEKLMYINYPHSPTGAICAAEDFQVMVDFCNAHKIVGCYDATYRELSFNSHPTLMNAKGARDWCVEMGSLSKTFDMVGWRMGYLVGNSEIISAVRKVKSAIDVGQFVPIQYAAALALKMLSYVDEVSKRYKERIDAGIKILREKGYDVFEPGGGYFIWVKVPKGFKTSEEYIRHVWETKKVLLMPGVGFGDCGEGYFRVSVTCPIEKITAGLNKLDKVN